MELTWHGHSTWRVTVGDTDLLIDPFFDNPFTDTDPEELDPDHVLLTHGHADHIADVDRFRGAHFVATPELAGWLGDQHGIDTDYGTSAGMPAGFVISNTKPTQVADEESETFYHAGDTSLHTEMRDVVAPYLEPDAVAVPVGDHFTMGPWQAAVAVDWIDADVVFPMHYDTFPPIEIDVEDFEREVEAVGSDAQVHVLDGDETFDLTEGY